MKQEMLAIFSRMVLWECGRGVEGWGARDREERGVTWGITNPKVFLYVFKQDTLAIFQKQFCGNLGILFETGFAWAGGRRVGKRDSAGGHRQYRIFFGFPTQETLAFFFLCFLGLGGLGPSPG